jgi:hypothetical protein
MSQQLEATRWSRRQRGQAAETTAPPGFHPNNTTLKQKTPIQPPTNLHATPAAATSATNSSIPPFAIPAPQATLEPTNTTPVYNYNGSASAPPFHATPAYHHQSGQSFFHQPHPPPPHAFGQFGPHPSASSNSDVTSVYVQPTPQPSSSVPNPYMTHPPYGPYHHQHAPPMQPDDNLRMMQHMDRIQNQMKNDHIALEKRFQATLNSTVMEFSKALKEALQVPPIPEIQYSSASSSTMSSNLIDFKSKVAPPTTVPPVHMHVPAPAPTQPETSTPTPGPSAMENDPHVETLEMMKLLVLQKEPAKLHFTPLTEHTDIQNWTYMSALECSKTHKYKDLTTRNGKNQICFKTALTVEQSETLYLLIHKAIAKMNKKLILDTKNPDGLLLLVPRSRDGIIEKLDIIEFIAH